MDSRFATLESQWDGITWDTYPNNNGLWNLFRLSSQGHTYHEGIWAQTSSKIIRVATVSKRAEPISSFPSPFQTHPNSITLSVFKIKEMEEIHAFATLATKRLMFFFFFWFPRINETKDGD